MNQQHYMKSLQQSLDALNKAKKVIRQWHSMGATGEKELHMWEIYENNAPEMKPINSEVARLDAELSILTPPAPQEQPAADPDNK